MGEREAHDSGTASRPAVTVRGFVAVPLPLALQQRLWRSVHRLAGEVPDVKWCKKLENLHVTIKFLGQVSLSLLEDLTEALRPAVACIPAFEGQVALVTAGFGGFPTMSDATVIWARVADTVDTDNGFERLAEAVEETAARLGLPRERDRRFRAHVTLGRNKRGVDIRPLLRGEHRTGERGTGERGTTDGGSGVFRVESLALYESRLGGEGATYLRRGQVALGGAIQPA